MATPPRCAVLCCPLQVPSSSQEFSQEELLLLAQAKHLHPGQFAPGVIERYAGTAQPKAAKSSKTKLDDSVFGGPAIRPGLERAPRKPKPNAPCVCGSGRKQKKCCPHLLR